MNEPNSTAEQDPIAAAQAARLRHVSDASPGIRRVAQGKGFRYVAPDGTRVRDAATLARIRALAIPPAWKNVWVCTIAHGHLQASGRDARGRKQYRYHARWRATRDETKYGHMAAFGAALPRIRRRVARDLRTAGLTRERVLALVVRLLETTSMRVGNEEYVRANGSYGLTTLRNRHVDVSGARLRFHFRGKSGKEHEIDVENRALARIVKRCRDLPGQDLFQYVDEAGARHAIDSGDVNEYLREIANGEFTAKDFRTWSGTLLAARELARAGELERASRANKACVAAVASVAATLGNTSAVCKKSYIHPAVLRAFEDARLQRLWRRHARPRSAPSGLTREEHGLLRFLDAATRGAPRRSRSPRTRSRTTPRRRHAAPTERGVRVNLRSARRAALRASRRRRPAR